VEVCNLAGCVSASATVSVILAPVITQPPLPLTVAPGERVTLSVGVAGYPPPFTYEWRRLATPIQTNTSDATMDFLTVIAPSYPTQQNFRVIVKNPANPVGVASAFATLTVAADTDADGLPDPWELAYGFPTNSAASRGLDSDGDGLTDYDEYRAGTNPTDASSCLRLEGLVADTNALLTFTAQSNRTYTILWGDTLNLLNGQRLADVPASPTQQLYQLSVPLLRVGNRFFRITTPRLSPP
jgi:hypothetical protein